eukprot:jgi/Ulvmu1/8814/UM048_0069.1
MKCRGNEHRQWRTAPAVLIAALAASTLRTLAQACTTEGAACCMNGAGSFCLHSELACNTNTNVCVVAADNPGFIDPGDGCTGSEAFDPITGQCETCGQLKRLCCPDPDGGVPTGPGLEGGDCIANANSGIRCLDENGAEPSGQFRCFKCNSNRDECCPGDICENDLACFDDDNNPATPKTCTSAPL